MTTSVETKPLYQRLKDEGFGNPIGQTLTDVTMSTLKIEDKRTAYDLQVALNNVLAALEVEELPGETEAFADFEANAGTASDVPLFQRLDKEDPSVGNQVRKGLLELTVFSLGMTDDVRTEYLSALDGFETALGLPTDEEFSANPDAFPNVLPV